MEVVRGQRVCVVCWGDKDRSRLENSTCMVMLDARGYPCDVLTLPQFSGLIPASPPHLGSLYEDDRKAEDAAAIVTFLEKHWPHLIVVGTTSVSCWQLQEDIKKICEDEITQVSHTPALAGVCDAELCELCVAPRLGAVEEVAGVHKLVQCTCMCTCQKILS